MSQTISAKQLRQDLGKILERVRQGERFTVLYRSRPVCDLIPPFAAEAEAGPVDEDPLLSVDGIAASTDDRTSEDHDLDLYGPA
jgi:antitoxin (DNA-binding transcriptional repressor) of toxin-antitoxin stability system